VPIRRSGDGELCRSGRGRGSYIDLEERGIALSHLGRSPLPAGAGGRSPRMANDRPRAGPTWVHERCGTRHRRECRHEGGRVLERSECRHEGLQGPEGPREKRQARCWDVAQTQWLPRRGGRARGGLDADAESKGVARRGQECSRFTLSTEGVRRIAGATMMGTARQKRRLRRANAVRRKSARRSRLAYDYIQGIRGDDNGRGRVGDTVTMTMKSRLP